MVDTGLVDRAALVAELNDLLQLDHDALGVYTVALTSLRTPAYRGTIAEFRADHERHVRDLSAMIRRLGGIPLRLPHVPTGFLKLAVQLFGILGGERAVLLAFQANELQVRNKYARHADRPHGAEVAELLHRNAADEARHYAWVSLTLNELGWGGTSPVGLSSAAFARLHGTNADMVEATERLLMEGAARTLPFGRSGR